MLLNRYRLKRLLGWIVTNAQSLRWVTQGIILRRMWSGRVDGTKRCLDVGCGGGSYAIEHFLRKGAHATLCDYSPELTELAASQVKSEGFAARAEVLQASAYTLPFPDASFECVQCIEVLEHLEDPGAALREIYRVAKPGATFIASTPHPPEWYENTGHMVEGYTVESMTELLEKNGWKVERVEVCALILARLVFAATMWLRVPLPLNPLALLESLVPTGWRKFFLPSNVIGLARRP